MKINLFLKRLEQISALILIAALLCGCNQKAAPIKWEYSVERYQDSGQKWEAEEMQKHGASEYEKLEASAKARTGEFSGYSLDLASKGDNGWELATATIEPDGHHMVLIFKRPLK